MGAFVGVTIREGSFPPLPSVMAVPDIKPTQPSSSESIAGAPFWSADPTYPDDGDPED